MKSVFICKSGSRQGQKFLKSKTGMYMKRGYGLKMCLYVVWKCSILTALPPNFSSNQVHF